jgi:hypothetical protein
MKNGILYILDKDGNPVPEPDVLKWGEWIKHNREHISVARNEVSGYTVSTVFLGADYSWGKEPELYETAVFGADDDMIRQRYATKKEALKGHLEVINQIKRKVKRGHNARGLCPKFIERYSHRVIPFFSRWHVTG